jgi:hypothetical protein
VAEVTVAEVAAAEVADAEEETNMGLQAIIERFSGEKLSVQPRSFFSLDDNMRQYFRDLSAYEAPFLKEKLLMEKECTAEEYEERFTEFKKYISIARIYREQLDMPSKEVDAVWHQFILFTRDYFDFCDRFYGKYFHHSPNIPSRPGSSDAGKLAELYNKTYGKMPAVWNVCEHRNKCEGL